ncbi:MAG: tRNA lysidine(34) synthetase TilS [Clostridia bacterium]|nr:tRNA lysidine(34) synthetase TilS [Clostridia bacterium]
MIPSPFNVDRAFCAFMEAHPRSGLLIALSGGADSVVLLHLASRYKELLCYRLEALHVHHGIRGAEADRDRDFCRSICERLQIPLTVVEYDIPALAATEKAGLEETARKYRYLALEKCAAARNFDGIATAHTATDNMETVLLQLTRGTASLHGIPPMRGAYLRPLLSVTREEILSYLNEYDLPHVEDSSNDSDAYSRNLIRHSVLPVLRQLNPRAEEAFGRAVAHAREDDDYLQALALPVAERGDVRELASLPAPLRSRALIARCKRLGIGTLSEVHIDALVRLCQSAVAHASLSLPGGAVAVENGLLVRKSDTPDMDNWEVELHPGENLLPDGSILCVLRENEAEVEKYIAHQQNIYKLLINATLNFATIEGTMVARARRAGDRIRSGGMHRSVKKLFCDAKIPLKDRTISPIVCDRNGILWIPTLRRIRDSAVEGDSSCISLIWCKNRSER